MAMSRASKVQGPDSTIIDLQRHTEAGGSKTEQGQGDMRWARTWQIKCAYQMSQRLPTWGSTMWTRRSRPEKKGRANTSRLPRRALTTYRMQNPCLCRMMMTMGW